MQYNQKHKSALHKYIDADDNTAITRTTFEWFYFVIIVVLISGFVFSFVFRISEISLRENEKISVLVSSFGYRACTGDEVVVRNKNTGYKAHIIAVGGQTITTYGYDFAVDGVLPENIHQANGVSELCGNKMKIPDGYVLTASDDLSGNGTYTAELIKEDNIYGKIHSVIYPIKYFNKSVDDVRE
ncbi:MAG: hypothetical protein PUG48_04885 [Clostridia bacterium]|nr:hypothetical protein [Clostridia bacterium]